MKIKKTKAVAGVSDIRIRKKLRALLSKAMEDENERYKLQELELIEKELLESTHKKKQDQLKDRLKKQLGLDESELEDEEESDAELDEASYEEPSNESEEEDNEGMEGEENEDEPEDDSFTFKGTVQTHEEEQMFGNEKEED